MFECSSLNWINEWVWMCASFVYVWFVCVCSMHVSVCTSYMYMYYNRQRIGCVRKWNHAYNNNNNNNGMLSSIWAPLLCLCLFIHSFYFCSHFTAINMLLGKHWNVFSWCICISQVVRSMSLTSVWLLLSLSLLLYFSLYLLLFYIIIQMDDKLTKPFYICTSFSFIIQHVNT